MEHPKTFLFLQMVRVNFQAKYSRAILQVRIIFGLEKYFVDKRFGPREETLH